MKKLFLFSLIAIFLSFGCKKRKQGLKGPAGTNGINGTKWY